MKFRYLSCLLWDTKILKEGIETMGPCIFVSFINIWSEGTYLIPVNCLYYFGLNSCLIISSRSFVRSLSGRKRTCVELRSSTSAEIPEAANGWNTEIRVFNIYTGVVMEMRVPYKGLIRKNCWETESACMRRTENSNIWRWRPKMKMSREVQKMVRESIWVFHSLQYNHTHPRYRSMEFE